MRTIYKYIIPQSGGLQCIKMRKDAQIISVQMQGGSLCLWAEVMADNPEEDREFQVFGTGEEIPLNANDEGFNFGWQGTVQDGAFVWHVYERYTA